MFTLRNAVLVSVALSAVIVGGAVISALQTPDSDGKGADTYGTRWNGYRGAMELVEELGTKVERRTAPPSPDMPTTATLVLWNPDPDLAAVEPAYLQAIAGWVERGGRVVVAPGANDEPTGVRTVMRKRQGPRRTVLEILGLDGVEVRQRPGVEERRRREGAKSDRDTVEEFMRKVWVPGRLNVLEAPLAAGGTLERIGPRATTIAVDQDKEATIEPGNERPAGELSYEADGKRRLVAAAFARGEGEIIVLADALVTANALLGKADNAVVAYDLIAGGAAAGEGRSVVFDEFYHGLTIRGNPFWLLTRPGYGLFTAAGLTLLGLAVWRRGILLGPPLTSPEKSRRTINEYVDAMSRFFHRARGSRIFILTEVRGGVLRALAQRAGTAPGNPDPERIAGALERRSASEARRFREAVRRADAAISRGRHCSEAEALAALEGISNCL